jgi:hypothetical protein
LENLKIPILEDWQDLLITSFSRLSSKMEVVLRIQKTHGFALLESVLDDDSTGDIIVTSKIEVPAQRIQFLFGNAKSMAMVVGVGLDFATVYLSRENVITVEKINQLEWEQLWKEAFQKGSSFHEPILISHFGICMANIEELRDDVYDLQTADGSSIILLKVFALFFMTDYLLQLDVVTIHDFF